MRKLFYVVVFLLGVFAFFKQPANAYAQAACTGDSGGAGTCTAAMACAPSNIDGQGTCTDPNQICCLTTAPGDGGSGQCGDNCSSSADCADTPINLQCSAGICNDPATCSVCTGNSGYTGTCMSPGVCVGLGKNANDGTSGCSMGNVCCTDAPTGQQCSFSLPSPVTVGYTYNATLNSNTPNQTYNLTGDCYQTATVTTNAAGSAQFALQCTSTGPKVIEARIAPAVILCSANYTVTDCPPGGCPPTPPGGGGGPGSIDWGALIGIGSPAFPLGSTVANIVSVLLPYIFGIAGFLLLLYIVWGGYEILTSQGDPKGIAAGREKITYAVVGFIIMFVSYWIVKLVGQILNLQPIINIFG